MSGDEGKSSALRGSVFRDVLRGTGGADRLYGFAGGDQLYGYGGRDVIVPGAGPDLVLAGNGNDRIDVRDGSVDIVFCGHGVDRVAADPRDAVKEDCELRNLDPAALPKAPPPVSKRVVMRPRASAREDLFRLTVNLRGSGRVISKPAGISCPGLCRAIFPSGTRVILTATPSAGGMFDEWAARCSGKRFSCALRLASNSWVGASFTGPTGIPTPAPPPPSSPPSGQQVVLNGSPWECDGPVNLDLVKVTNPSADAIQLGSGCTGVIRRIEVDTGRKDGVKIQNLGDPAHDLVIESGYVRCYDIEPGAHQDAVQAMGGRNVTFWNVELDCRGNSNFFVNRAGSGASTPTDIVCVGCRFGPSSATTVRVENAVRSGVRNSQACVGRRVDEAIYFGHNAIGPIDAGNTVLPETDPFCRR